MSVRAVTVHCKRATPSARCHIRYDGEDILLEYDGSNVLQAKYTHGPGIDEPLSRTVVTAGVSSGYTAVLASTADGLRGPVVDDTIVVNGQIYLGFLSGSSFLPPVGQPIDSTGSHLPVAPIDVTTAANSGTLTVSLVDTATLSGNAPVYLVIREQATGRVLESQLLFPARLTATSTAQPGLPTVIAATTVPISTPVAGSTLFYHQDGLGTVTELTDSNGSVAKAYAYDAYGTILESPGTVEQPYTYTGREFDSEMGLYYYRARYYDAVAGRFLQKDPVGLKAGPNGYWYANANPVFFVDPFGMMSRAQCDELRARIFRKVGDLVDDLIRYDPVADGIGGHLTHGGKKTSPGGHHEEIQQRQRGIGRDLTRYAKECTKRCNDGPPPPPLPEWVEEVATRPIPDVVYPVPQGPMIFGPVDSVPIPDLPDFMTRPTFSRPLMIP